MRKIVIYLLISLLSLLECTGIPFANCGITKTCITNIPRCSISDPNCLFFSYAWNEETSLFDMEMSRSIAQGQQWYGIAFSPTGNMINSDLYVCTGSSFLSGVIRERSYPIILNALPPNVTSISYESISGIRTCAFSRPASVTKDIIGMVARDFNLLEADYHLLQAYGSYNPNAQSLSYHLTNRWSSGPYDFSPLIPTEQQLTTPFFTTPSFTTLPTTSPQVSTYQIRNFTIVDGSATKSIGVPYATSDATIPHISTTQSRMTSTTTSSAFGLHFSINLMTLGFLLYLMKTFSM